MSETDVEQVKMFMPMYCRMKFKGRGDGKCYNGRCAISVWGGIGDFVNEFGCEAPMLLSDERVISEV